MLLLRKTTLSSWLHLFAACHSLLSTLQMCWRVRVEVVVVVVLPVSILHHDCCVKPLFSCLCGWNWSLSTLFQIHSTCYVKEKRKKTSSKITTTKKILSLFNKSTSQYTFCKNWEQHYDIWSCFTCLWSLDFSRCQTPTRENLPRTKCARVDDLSVTAGLSSVFHIFSWKP